MSSLTFQTLLLSYCCYMLETIAITLKKEKSSLFSFYIYIFDSQGAAQIKIGYVLIGPDGKNAEEIHALC